MWKTEAQKNVSECNLEKKLIKFFERGQGEGGGPQVRPDWCFDVTWPSCETRRNCAKFTTHSGKTFILV